jgi:flagellar hook protein FlgE
MIRSLFSGVSGLRNQQLKMDVIGNNIANVNTIGFKGSRVNFLEELGQLLLGAGQSVAGGTTNPIQIGRGVRTGSVDRQFLQGILQTTGLQTDLGLQGDGFFIVGDAERQFYTRAGNFHFDSQGRLVNSSGFIVKGWMADASGELSQSATLSDIIMDPSLVSPAIATSNISIVGNLDASALITKEVWTASKTLTEAATGNPAVGATELNDLTQTTTPLIDGDTITITGTNPDGTQVSATFTYGAANDGTTLDNLLTVINSAFSGATATLNNGNIVLSDDNFGDSKLSITLANGDTNTGAIALPSFVNTTEGVTPLVTTSTIVYDSLGTAHTLNIKFTKTENEREWKFQVGFSGGETITQGGTGTLTFKADGSLETVIYDRAESTLIFDPQNGAGPVSIDMDFGNNAKLSGLTLFDGNSNVDIAFQDGQAVGNLSSFFVDEQGRILGTFTNGKNRMIAQVALARFNNPEGLTHLGNNLFATTEGSGTARVGKAGEEFDTAVVSGSLEASNVDLAEEFTEMILAQRAFQANARVLTVSDQFLSEVVQLKR